MTKLLDRCPILKEMLESESALSLEGDEIPIHSNIPQRYAEALYEVVLRTRPSIAVEVGMGFGVSSLAILAALRDGGQDGKLISIDPNQSTDWDGCGLTAVAQAGLNDRHELFEDFDYVVLPRLLSSGLKIDFAYIDGWHTFDYVLLDWWYLDKMLAAEGIIGFNDCGWPAVDKVLQFLLTHRKYVEIDVGLPVHHVGLRDGSRSPQSEISGDTKELSRRAEDRYFKKKRSWEPSWDFFADF
jgi:predicted O-methyltransferase YrrM